MRRRHILLMVVAALFSLSKGSAQSQFTGWLASFNTIKAGKKTSVHADVQWRGSDEFKHTQTLLLRSGLNYHLNKKVILTAGYAFIQNRRTIGAVSGYAPEHRTWEQLVFNHKLKTIFVSHRLRLEQRYISTSEVAGGELERTGTVYANRARYFIRSILPLASKDQTFSKGPFVALQDEVFANFGNKANVNGKFFDQNRLYLAVGYRLNPSFDLETGYMNQYTEGRNEAFTNNHVWQLAGYLRL
jgi:hypothetical protein